VWVFAGALALAVLVSGGAVRRYFVRRGELARLETRLAQSQERMRILQARRERADTDEMFIETSARRELSLLAPNEIEFRFVARASSATVRNQ
jgi:cell division protein FtsB